MVDCLLDTSIIVDLLRGYPPALSWIGTPQAPGLTTVVWLEIIEGAWDKASMNRAVKLLKQFERINTIPDDFDWAIIHLPKFRLSHRTDMNDCLIAATSYRLSLPLHTRNLKHFVPLLGAAASQPY